ncbi:MAG: hypothetical protein FJX54_07060 [Alphaproteobacteria bacterium]|nr:hypothetical protein [Alphaproteobacteria bacterium]
MLALAVSACQPLTRPFEDQGKETNDLLRLANRGGVVVLPIEGVPNPAAFAEALAVELRKLEVPATTRAGASEALRLAGRAEAAPRDGTRDEIEISWRLAQASGAIIAGRTGSWIVPRAPWAQGTPEAIAAVAQLAAPDLAGMIEGDRPVTRPGPSLVVWAVDGAPGDGAVTLKAALERALRRSGYRVLPELKEDSLVVAGAVQVRRTGAGQDRVAIVWSILDSDGAELAQVDQENSVATGLLDGPWGEVARQVAAGALEGIIEVVEQVKKKAAG